MDRSVALRSLELLMIMIHSPTCIWPLKWVSFFWSCPFSWPAYPGPVIAGACWFLALRCCWFYKGENCLEAMLGEEENPSQRHIPKQPSIILILSNTVTILVQQHKPDIFYWCTASFFRICLMTLLRPVVFIQRALHLLCGVTFKIQSCQNGPHALHRWLETPLSLPVFRVGMGVGRE